MSIDTRWTIAPRLSEMAQFAAAGVRDVQLVRTVLRDDHSDAYAASGLEGNIAEIEARFVGLARVLTHLAAGGDGNIVASASGYLLNPGDAK